MNTASESTLALKLSELRTVLAAYPELPLTVVWTDGEPIKAHFHVTEVGRVQKDFVDCGSTVRRVTTCLLQTWVGDDTDHRITADKLLKAITAAAPVLGGEDLPVELEYETCNVVQLKVSAVERSGDGLSIQLASKHTDCLAKDVCLPSGAGTCQPGSGCC
jgi:Family of unknown function (DUF6428)